MDASLAKGLIEDVIRLSIELSDVKRDHVALEKKHTELLTEYERVKNLLEMYCAEARREIEKKEFNIVEAIASAGTAVESVGNVVVTVEKTEEVNSDATEEKNVIIEPLDAKKAKRKEYMKTYMKKKRGAKGSE